MLLGPDRVAIITGAASGIGRALSLHLAQKGCDLALVDVNQSGLNETASSVALAGRHASVHLVDVSNPSQMQSLPETVLRSHSAVHLLVNNAGVSLASPFESGSVEDMHWIIGINLWGVIYGCKFFLPYLRRATEAHIVNISSDFGLIGFPTKTLYCTSKFGLRGFSEALRAELYGSRVGLTCVYPGAVSTGLIRNGRAWDTKQMESEARFVEARSMSIDKVADKILKAIERKRARVLIGSESYAIDMMARLFPVLTNNLVGRLQKRLPFL